ncbi:MAG: hypothetical protein AAF485_11935 [Chloroflexota bacterium]
MAVQTKKVCRYCGEEIQAVAIKCRYCGEFLDDNPRPVSGNRIKGDRNVGGNLNTGGGDAVFGNQDNSINQKNNIFRFPPIQSVLILMVGMLVGWLVFTFAGPSMPSWVPAPPISWGWVGIVVGFLVTLQLISRGGLSGLFNTQRFIPLIAGSLAGAVLFDSILEPYFETFEIAVPFLTSWWWFGAFVGFFITLAVISPTTSNSLQRLKPLISFVFWPIISAILFAYFLGPNLEEMFGLTNLSISWIWIGAGVGLLISLGAAGWLLLNFDNLAFVRRFIALPIGTVIIAILFVTYAVPYFDTITFLPQPPVSWNIVGAIIGFLITWRMTRRR